MQDSLTATISIVANNCKQSQRPSAFRGSVPLRSISPSGVIDAATNKGRKWSIVMRTWIGTGAFSYRAPNSRVLKDWAKSNAGSTMPKAVIAVRNDRKIFIVAIITGSVGCTAVDDNCSIRALQCTAVVDKTFSRGYLNASNGPKSSIADPKNEITETVIATLLSKAAKPVISRIRISNLNGRITEKDTNMEPHML